MRRNSVFEGLQKETKLLLSPFLSKSKLFQHLFLYVCLVYPDGSSAKLSTVKHYIVGLGPYPSRVAVYILPVLLHGCSEGMVHGSEPALLL